MSMIDNTILYIIYNTILLLSSLYLFSTGSLHNEVLLGDDKIILKSFIALGLILNIGVKNCVRTTSLLFRH